MNTNSKCPECGAAIPGNAPEGLCPNCLMAMNLKTETVFTGDLTAAQAPLPPEQIAAQFPQLEILECLGRGGMGVVYKARQRTLNRLVALKLLAPERVGDAKFAERFAREAQALAALNHPNIVTIHDFGQAGGFYFLLMEYVDGLNLRQLLRTRKFTPEEALAIVPPLCDALQFAHERGIVHRDIKPENLLLDKAGRIKVADFGIAKMLGDKSSESGEASSSDAATQNALGTPGYSAPEQRTDPQRVDSRADIYSLGVVFYEMLTGELPGQRIEPPSRKIRMDVRLDEVVLRALEKTPELRWQTASEMRTSVEAITGKGSALKGGQGAMSGTDLNWMRLKILGWSLALAAATIEMSFGFQVWGVWLLVGTAMLVLLAGDNLKVLGMAKKLAAVNGLVVAGAAMWFICHTPTLKVSWLIAVFVGCGLGIRYCLICLAKAVREDLPGSAPWTMAKSVIVGAMVIALMAGTGVAGWQHYGPQRFNEASWKLDNQTLMKIPSVVAVWPSHEGEAAGTSSTDKSFLARAVPLKTMMSYAYGQPKSYVRWSENRVILQPGMANEKYDILLTIPNEPQKALQEKIKSQFGLVAHWETREMEVLFMVVANPGASGLKVATGAEPGSDTGAAPGRTSFEFTDMPIDDLSDFLEASLGRLVINGTEMTGKYSGKLAWEAQSDKAEELKAVQSVLKSQFGLALGPGRYPVPMLVVERVQ